MRPLFLFGRIAILASGQADFRKAWGMTQAQALATEANRPSEVRQGDGEMIVRYDSIQLSGLVGRAVYIFGKDKLVRAKFLFDVEHDEESDFIVDSKTIEPVLILHGLTGQDHHITHQIEYLGVELEGLENGVRGSAQ